MGRLAASSLRSALGLSALSLSKNIQKRGDADNKYFGSPEQALFPPTPSFFIWGSGLRQCFYPPFRTERTVPGLRTAAVRAISKPGDLRAAARVNPRGLQTGGPELKFQLTFLALLPQRTREEPSGLQVAAHGFRIENTKTCLFQKTSQSGSRPKI